MSDSPSLGFTPVPLRGRADGWSAERQRLFIDALRQMRSVGRAVRAVGLSRASAYRLRDRSDAASFAAAWDAAFVPSPPRPSSPALTPLATRAEAKARQAADLWNRAVNGRAKAIMRKGREVGVRVCPDSVAALTLLRRFDRALAGRDADPGRPRKSPRARKPRFQ